MNTTAAAGLTGELALTLAPRGTRTVAVGQRHAGTLQTLRPMYLDGSGQVTYHVVNPGGGCLRGDTYAIDIELEAGASAVLTTQSATKVYRTPDAAATQHMRIRLGAGAVLEYVPDALILYREATYRQSCTVELDESATLVLAEIVTPGWSPDGARFRYDELRMRTEIHRGGALLAVDNLLIEPGRADPSGIGFLDGHTHVGSLTVVDPRIDDALLDEVHALTEAAGTVRSGLTALSGPGFVLRCLGDDTAELANLFDEVIALLRSRWTGQAPLHLRKY
ncbi:urease accessory protein UreD [Tsukamurella pulmonis]|uniref:Urease accessory protein UreD n=1 Tax=Tsukamurella pulmonis TaxID=47312 RepID=A0A1H1DSM8_9ACTN|nr:urease accessory protein UreD [Tsukamurella pulmonis]KXO92226.1 urease accessory protein UreD [Tsukamurella pulmonis]SDQ79259.1 urease accessory protein [Tsukamurella pulmonis]SUP21751.1 Urease accessory protein UreD [Tsukamurella pulmonis]